MLIRQIGHLLGAPLAQPDAMSPPSADKRESPGVGADLEIRAADEIVPQRLAKAFSLQG